MKFLEAKIPPPLLTIIFGLAVWGIATVLPGLDISRDIRLTILIVMVAVGLVLTVSALLTFWKAKTTIDPNHLHKATTVVKHGIYKFSRNPMYLALLIYLTALTIYMANLYALPLPVLFVLYMNRFQIQPEESMMTSLFGEAYLSYKNQVRRWI